MIRNLFFSYQGTFRVRLPVSGDGQFALATRWPLPFQA